MKLSVFVEERFIKYQQQLIAGLVYRSSPVAEFGTVGQDESVNSRFIQLPIFKKLRKAPIRVPTHRNLVNS